VARSKLAWWRSEIARLFNGDPQHPVSKALAPAITQFDLPQEHFLEIIDGMEMDLDYSSYESFKDLSLYCHRVASIVGIMSAEIFGYQDRQTLKYAHHLGMAFQLTNILRDVREDCHRGRLYLPLDELRQYDVTIEDLTEKYTSDKVRALFEFQAKRAQDYYQRAYATLPAIDRYTQRGGLIMAAIYRRILDKITNDNFNVLEKRVSLTPLHKLWLAWRTNRQEKQRYKPVAQA
jgi:phytoene synthase